MKRETAEKAEKGFLILLTVALCLNIALVLITIASILRDWNDKGQDTKLRQENKRLRQQVELQTDTMQMYRQWFDAAVE